MELHATLELLAGTASRTALTADTEAERPHLPDADSLFDALLLVDRGYFDVAYLAAVDRAGGHFVARANAGINPTVLFAAAAGRELAGLRGRPLRQCKLPKDGPVDLDVSSGSTSHFVSRDRNSSARRLDGDRPSSADLVAGRTARRHDP